MRLGLIGRKLGMTRIYSDEGNSFSATVVELGPCKVMRKRTQDKHGYTAIQLGFGEKRTKLFNKPELKAFEKIEQEPVRVLKEFRIPQEELDKLNEGEDVTCEIFSEGQKVDISGISKGRGFAGVIKRHHMGGFPATHGTHETKRHGGSIGCRAKPGRIFPGKHMAGHMGNRNVTTQNIKVLKIIPEDNIILLRGSVPGPNRSFVEIRPAVKVKGSRRSA